MKIGEFIKAVNTTKDTVRHYEDLKLIQPSWKGSVKDYKDKDINDFMAIKEMKDMGLNLKDIQVIFEVKRNFGCGSPSLLSNIKQKLHHQLYALQEEEKEIKKKKLNLQETLKELDQLI